MADHSQPAPVLVERRCGGWLAISGEDEPIKIGVIAETEDGAAELYEATILAWRRNLDLRHRRPFFYPLPPAPEQQP